MGKFTHKVTTTNQVTIEGNVRTDGTVLVDDEIKDIAEILQNGFKGEAVKITITKKTEEEIA